MSGLARQVAEVMDALCARLTRRLNLIKLPGRMTPERVRTLAVLDKQGPLSVTALAVLENVRPTTMSRMISSLEEEGFVKRRGCSTDGRGVLVSMTAKGRRTYQRARDTRLEQLTNGRRGREAEEPIDGEPCGAAKARPASNAGVGGLRETGVRG